MNRLIAFLLLVPALYLPSCSRKTDSDYTKPFSEINKQKETFVAEKLKEEGPKIISAEGGAYADHQRWLRFWGPRIAPDGTYQSYNKNLRSYYDLHQKDYAPYRAALAPGNTDDWKELGPFNTPIGGSPYDPNCGAAGTLGQCGQVGVGIIQRLVINRQNPSKLLANSQAGGLFFSADKGMNWVNAGSDSWFRSGCEAAAFAPDNETTWYAGSNTGGYAWSAIGAVGGVYRTTTAGVTWDIIADRTAFNPNNPGAGESTIIRKIIIDPKNPNIGYVATNGGLFKSANINAVLPASVSWNVVHGDDVQDMEFTTDTSPVSTLIIAYETAGAWDIAKTTDQAATWASLPSQSHVGTTQLVLAVTDAAPNLLYVLDRQSFAGISVFDFGTNIWSPKKQGIDNEIGAGQCFGVSNFNKDIVYVGDLDIIGDGGVYVTKSTDGGLTFPTPVNPIYPPSYHNDVECIVTPSGNFANCAHEVYLTTHGGVNYSSDDMATLQSRSNGLGLADCGGSGSQEHPERIAIGVGHDGSIISSGIYGTFPLTWTTVGGGDGGQALIDYSNGDHVWIEHQREVHEFSYTGNVFGPYVPTSFAIMNDWTNRIAQNQIFPNVVYSKSATNGPASYEDVFRSNNYGVGGIIQRISDFKTYNALGPNRVVGDILPSPSNPSFLYVTENEYINYTSHLFRNTGATGNANTMTTSWVELSFPVSQKYACAAVDLHNPNIVYFGYFGYSWLAPQFFKADYTLSPANPPVLTEFAGTQALGGLPNTQIDSIVLERGSNGGIYAATDVGVFYTNNSMINWNTPSASQWIRLGQTLPNIPLNNMDINYTVNKIRAYTTGRGVWEHDLACPSALSLNLFGTQSNSAFLEAVNDITSIAQIGSSDSVTYRGGTHVDMNPGFLGAPDSSHYFYAFIHPCNTSGNSPAF